MKTPLRVFYESLLQSQWWNRDQLVRLQRQHLTSLLTHARNTSPFYRYRLNSMFHANGTIDWDQWIKVPIVTRADLSKNFDNFLSRAPVAAHGPFNDIKSSGATGDPVTVRTTRWMGDMVAGCNWRAHKWHGIDWSGTMLNRVFSHRPTLKTGDKTGPWGPPWDVDAARGQSIIIDKHSLDIEKQLPYMRHYKPDYATIGGPVLAELLDLNERASQQVKLKAFLVRGGAVEQNVRESVKASFGADVLELYSSKEAGPIAHPCPDRPEVFHINDEAVLVEIVDKDGAPCLPGVAGRVIVTPFASTALPLIRYDQGDIAVAGQTCICGRGLQTMEQIVGRTFDAFRHQDGRVILPNKYLTVLRPLIAARRWQIAQVGPTTYEVRLPAGVTYREDGFDEFAEKAKTILFGDATIVFTRDCTFTVDVHGKFKEYVNEWNPKRSFPN